MNNIKEYFNNNKNTLNIEIHNEHLFNLFVDIYKWADESTSDQKLRPEQQKFRDDIINRDSRCIVSNFASTECQACHIVPVEDGGNYDLNNGVLLNACLHITFDKYLWSINPDTLRIDVNSNDKNIVGSVINFVNTKPNIKINDSLKYNLKKRWEKYIEQKKKSQTN